MKKIKPVFFREYYLEVLTKCDPTQNHWKSSNLVLDLGLLDNPHISKGTQHPTFINLVGGFAQCDEFDFTYGYKSISQ